MRRLLDKFLLHKRLPALLACIAFGLASPSLWGNWQQDVFYHRWLIDGQSERPTVATVMMDCFSFLDGNPQHIQNHLDKGTVLWWTLPTL